MYGITVCGNRPPRVADLPVVSRQARNFAGIRDSSLAVFSGYGEECGEERLTIHSWLYFYEIDLTGR